VALATALGTLVGIDRELTDKDAGIRTHALVALGAAAFAAAGYAVLAVPGSLALRPDIGRIAAQVASGIGFIGAGLIIFRGGRLRGLTTAADLWVVAAIGVLAGLGFLVVASATAGLVLFVIVAGRALRRWLNHRLPRRLIESEQAADRE
jgi:putative Mg2+ transporter-C (MgtC) family protein